MKLINRGLCTTKWRRGMILNCCRTLFKSFYHFFKLKSFSNPNSFKLEPNFDHYLYLHLFSLAYLYNINLRWEFLWVLFTHKWSFYCIWGEVGTKTKTIWVISEIGKNNSFVGEVGIERKKSVVGKVGTVIINNLFIIKSLSCHT